MDRSVQSNADQDSAVDSQLDALISRIRSLNTGEKSARSETSPVAGEPKVTSASDASRPSERPAAGQLAAPAAAARPQDPAVPGRPPQAAAQQSAQTPQKQAVRRAAGETPASKPNAAESGTAAVAPKTNTGPAQANHGFAPSRDEPWRPREPEDFYSAGINESLLEAIVFRYLLNVGECEGRKIASQVKLPFRLVERVLTRFKSEHQVAYKSSTATNDYVYVLTESGRGVARSHANDCTYYGACPVRLQDYVDSVKEQTIEGQYPKRDDLNRAFRDLLINPKMLHRLGPAVASGRGMFLFGFPGNGKTSIAERVTGAFGKYLWIPRAVDIDGHIMRVFDPMNHQLAMPEDRAGWLDSGGFDKRWVRIKRPTIVAGGELTMEMLEVLRNPETNVSEAPLQLKSNCGTLVIDDFGRQKMSIDQLLNRWIIPLEKRYDFLNMSSGKKIEVPFDQLVIFSTNLEPKDLVDDAFLRRIPYKIEVENPPEADFRKLFEIMCKVTKIPYNADAIDYLIKTHYLPVDRPFRNCQPRDLLLQVRNYCMYNDLEIELKNEYFDFACENYFSVM